MTTQDEIQLMNIAELAALLGRSAKSVAADVTRRPNSLPPRFLVPGVRQVRWRVKEVKEWMGALVEMEQLRRAATNSIARKR